MRAAVLTLCLVAAPALGQVYKCNDAGRVVFSDYPCQRTDNRTIDVRPAAGGPVNRSTEYWEAQESAARAREAEERRRLYDLERASRDANQAAMRAETERFRRELEEAKALSEARRASPGRAASEIEAAKRAVLEMLRDPNSAMFRSVKLGHLGVCGEVNSRNGFGGYAGFQRFVSSAKLVVLESMMSPDEFQKTWLSAC